MADQNCGSSVSMSVEVVCSQCGARYERLPGLRCPRCGNALLGCGDCHGCGHGGASAGPGLLSRLAWWKRLAR